MKFEAADKIGVTKNPLRRLARSTNCRSIPSSRKENCRLVPVSGIFSQFCYDIAVEADNQYVATPTSKVLLKCFCTFKCAFD
ncbi:MULTISPECIES: hypothetical protein [unclassified Bradyrhizobium]|uniref:hypothetical protein n=1 Tax=unclassified Bradyrhizobium TaxID=2631580 RepID=UPI002304F0A0|nr:MULTISPECIES: hypothetical protein [unclassified Bradyrhizobium]MDA9448846.1 hypothetical protein [Bradyrhizobium sp. CCBAU 21360]MDA9515161.1 hypothetical protein [Bradyrhizobium sp. CCBAU 11430]